MSNRDRVPDASGVGRMVRPVAISVAAGVVVCIAFLLLFAFVLSTQNVPQSLISPMATAAISIGAFVGGYICAKIVRENGLVCGLITGVVLSFILLIASFGLGDSGFGIPALFKVIFILLLAMIGGVLGVNTRKKKRRK